MLVGLAISLVDPDTGGLQANSDGGSASRALAGVLLSLLSRFMSSLNTILAEQ